MPEMTVGQRVVQPMIGILFELIEPGHRKSERKKGTARLDQQVPFAKNALPQDAFDLGGESCAAAASCVLQFFSQSIDSIVQRLVGCVDQNARSWKPNTIARLDERIANGWVEPRKHSTEMSLLDRGVFRDPENIGGYPPSRLMS